MVYEQMIKIPLAKPFITNSTFQKLKAVSMTGFLTEGLQTAQFEKQIKNFLDVKYVICVTSATVGLELALIALKISKNKEVIIPNFTYPATINPFILNGYKINVIDCEYDSMNINLKKLEKKLSHNTGIVVPVSTFGNPLDYERLNYLKRNKESTFITKI